MHSVIGWMNSEDLMRSIVTLLSNTVLSVHVWVNSCSVMSYSLQPQAPQFVRFFRPEYWSGLPFCSPGDLPDPGMETTSPALAGVFSTTEPSGKPSLCCILESYWVQFSHSVVSDSLQPHGVQHTRLHCPSPTPRACSNSCPWSWGCHPTISSSVVPFSSCLQSFSASVFSKESVLRIRWPKYWSFSFSISPSNGYSGLISIRIDWLGLLAVQGTLKSLLQYHTSKVSILWCSAFFIVQLLHLYVTTGKTIALTRQTSIGKVTSLFFLICYLGWP